MQERINHKKKCWKNINLQNCFFVEDKLKAQQNWIVNEFQYCTLWSFQTDFNIVQYET